MKQKLLTTIVFIFLFGSIAEAQVFTIGPKVGISSTQVSLKDHADRFEEGDANYSYQVGAFARINILGFFVQPEAYFNSVQGEYVSRNNLGNKETVTLNQNKIDVPILFGYKLGPLRLNIGPVASFNMDSEVDKDDAVNEYKNAVFAYQAGIGVDISKLTLDLRYEGNFSDQATLGDDEGKVRINQVMLSLGLKLL
ncbi:PorT family protein [Marivirga sp. S37H4]|uniref:PorT family protein n=1 Tax=Marivirga aurantiaca TaxID=2802615 RepID=A0A935CCG5_9BACT|nr:porin family protein [Marivirga aurantiaca]MBK6266023.1 PorT family protein [Marivirga aurantiaca]